MNIFLVFRLAGKTLLIQAAAMVLPLLVGLIYGESPRPFLLSIAITAAEMALSGILQIIPFDEMLDTMYSVGKKMPAELRETALGGCAATPTGCAFACGKLKLTSPSHKAM